MPVYHSLLKNKQVHCYSDSENDTDSALETTMSFPSTKGRARTLTSQMADFLQAERMEMCAPCTGG